MSKVQFTRWSLNAESRTPVSIEAARVDCVEFFSDPHTRSATGEQFPAATRIIMQGKQEYLVQGTVAEVTKQLNAPNPHEVQTRLAMERLASALRTMPTSMRIRP